MPKQQELRQIVNHERVPQPNRKNQAAHLLGTYDLSFSTAVTSPEHSSHTHTSLTQAHEYTHRKLTFSSTFGFLSFVVAQIERWDPDPIHRFRLREIKDLLIEHSLDPHEGCAYFSEFLDATLVSADLASQVWKAASEREEWASRWTERATRVLRFGRGLQKGFAYLLADLSLSSPIIHDFSDSPPDVGRLHAYLSHRVNDPNARFLAFARRVFWRPRSLRRSFKNTLREFCKEQNVRREVVDTLDLERIQIARLNYLMDVAFQKWLADRLPEYRIVPVEERINAAQTLLDRWRPQLPAEVQAHLPASADFLQSTVFVDADDAALVNPEGLERLYRPVADVSSIPSELKYKELCLCLVTPDSYPLVKVNLFADGKIPDGSLAVTVAVFNPRLANCFEETGYFFWGAHNSILEQLRNWKAERMVLIVQFEDIAERGARVVGEPRSSFSCSLRALYSGLTLSHVPSYLQALGSEQFPVRAYVALSGKKQNIPVLLAKTDEHPKFECVAPMTPGTFFDMQAQQLEPWVEPKRDIGDYEQDQGQLQATVNACERIVRFGFG